MNAKQAAAYKAIEYIKDGMIVGLGTGSTAYWAVQYLAEKVKQGWQLTAVATSEETEKIALQCGITVVSLDTVDHIDIDIDGADEIDDNMNLVKGGGGALLREKIVAAASRELIVIAGDNKRVEVLGKFPLPVEVIPFGWQHTAGQLAALGCSTSLRKKDEKMFITDSGNYIIDCHFGAIPQPAMLEQRINNIPGVVDNGLFVKRATMVILGCDDGTVKTFTR
ncbi:ribose-5-phosphate isomerase RpiA [Agriterribacter sp.]|uniref:ribose-5-phosphate isomerase RpiA n=1 Tax=Agriterribacter sp. TaxID=2821509 RepID=UPI002C5C5427|nr:ribose-5-phosphate isomerase RpiA [Agriterribacter sp.]HRO46388.1 ribose-5-phosphate isomerase RpiA [Agriterribacter sp.]HRQ17576.1 ribose-5-phosphate isomerase RpiA [Agriterribacter sp.]